MQAAFTLNLFGHLLYMENLEVIIRASKLFMGITGTFRSFPYYNAKSIPVYKLPINPGPTVTAIAWRFSGFVASSALFTANGNYCS